jgi:hypothetical protein
LLTWIRGPAEHERELRERAKRLWADAEAINQEYVQQGGELYDLLPNGPRTQVNWCVPVMPGLMLANSEYHIARLYAAGGYNVVLFYGFGTIELGTIAGWIS